MEIALIIKQLRIFIVMPIAKNAMEPKSISA